jgi:hypothetical protein
MKNKISTKKIKNILGKQKGYAILFAVVITSIISVIVAGISNLTYKQLILSSLVKDSQQAFYMADTAIECALYAHFMKGDNYDNNTWSCGRSYVGAGNHFTLDVEEGVDTTEDNYELTHPTYNENTPCYEFNVDRDSIPDEVHIRARGYNICNKKLLRTVQREIEVYYSLTP